jgi:mono/diheme cytochrome c family protein
VRLITPSALALALCLSTAASLTAQTPAVRSTNAGVYTTDQADRGAETFRNICAGCHNQDNPISGRSFLNKWTGRPFFAIWTFVTTSMPYGNPASLAPEEYASVLAYILRLNGYPAGEKPIPSEPMEVANIDFDLPPGR